jgi:hypothetical protein
VPEHEPRAPLLDRDAHGAVLHKIGAWRSRST